MAPTNRPAGAETASETAIGAENLRRAALGIAELLARRRAARPYVETVTNEELLSRGQPWIKSRIDTLVALESVYSATGNPRRDLTARQLARLFTVATPEA